MKHIFFIPNSLFWALLLVGLLLVGAGLALAQDTPPPLTPGLDTIPTTPSGVIALFTFFGGSLVVTGVVGLLKLIPGNNLDANTLKEWVAVIVTVVYMAFVFTGNSGLFEQGADIFTKILPFITGLIGVFQGSSTTHNVASSVGLPLLGYKRTPTYPRRE